MKRISLFLAAALIALATGCDKGFEENQTPSTPDDAVVDEKPGDENPGDENGGDENQGDENQGDENQDEETGTVVLTALLPQTKTTLLDGYEVKWNKNDQLVVFNAPSGTADYSGNLHFFIDEEAKGEFTPGEGVEVPFEKDVNYDWYVCSPWRSTNGAAELVTPKGQSKEDGYFPIGAQTQTGYNNSVHVSGSDIMVGKATNTRTPVVTLKHLAVLHKFTVTNNSNLPTVIEKLTFNGGENKIFGTFWIDMTADEPAIDVTKANATFNERALTVKNGTELPVGESADFYIVTAPFILNAGETFKVTIETSTGSQVIEKTAAADIEFAAGSYNTANLEYSFTPPMQESADHLYQDTFNGTFSGSDKVTTTNTTFTPARWDSYDKAGMTVYDGNVTSVNYVHDNNSCLSRQAATVIVGMDDLFIWFKAGGVLTVNGIKLHGHTDLNLSFLQTYKSSGITTEYSVDNGTTWTPIGVSAHPAGNTVATYSYDFSVPAGSETISIRMTASTSTPRVDNIKLTWH